MARPHGIAVARDQIDCGLRRRKIGGQGDASTQCPHLARRSLADIGFARRDRHRRARAQQPFGDHPAQPLRAAGDDRLLARQAEQVAHIVTTTLPNL